MSRPLRQAQGRPLLVTDCDEVLLHMVAHFRDWVGEEHDLDFALDTGSFEGALTRRACGSAVPGEEIWPLLDGFFEGEMARQTLVPGVSDALARIGAVADVVILTNLQDRFNASRGEQLAALGIHHRVVTNQGGKGVPLRRLLDDYAPSVAAFVDDLPVHHQSAAKHVPEVWRLHMVAEPRLAPHVPPSPHAHARINDWNAAADWIMSRFAEGAPARLTEAARDAVAPA